MKATSTVTSRMKWRWSVIETALGFEDRLQREPEEVSAGFLVGGGEAFAVVGGVEAGVASGVGEVVAYAA
jgi:hypothetical protein